MPKSLPIALIGQKFMGRGHSNGWGQAPRFFDLPLTPTLAVACGRDEAELKQFAARWSWNRWTTDWRTLADDDEVALVDVGTPNHLHAEPAIAMLEAGKHVACEKPLAGTLAEAREMRDAARRSRGKTFVWFNYRRCPAVALAWQLLRKRRLGRIYHVRATYLQDWGGPETPMSWRFRKKTAGSGAHGDLNAHAVDLARFLLGEELVEVHGAVARTFVRERPIVGKRSKGRSDVDDAVLFTGSFRSGAVASFEATRLATGNQNANRIEINGELGSLRWDFEAMNLLHFYDASRDRQTAGWQRIMATAGDAHPYAAAYWPDAHLLGYEHTFVSMAADICRVLGGKKPTVPLADFADAYETQRVIEAALVSARERCAVRIAEID
jgi:predicted dehydrogenase